MSQKTENLVNMLDNLDNEYNLPGFTISFLLFFDVTTAGSEL